MKRQSCNFLIPAILMLIILNLAVPAKADSPAKVVEEFQAVLIEAMKAADKSTIRERFDQLERPVKKAFHMPLMAQMATGRYWQSATMDQKRAVVSAFGRMSIATLATLFDGYDGEAFSLVGEKSGAQGTTIIRTKLKKSDGELIQIDYRTLKIRDRWHLIDVIIDNTMSELTTKIDEYKPTLKKAGVPGLIRLLNDTADKLMSPS